MASPNINQLAATTLVNRSKTIADNVLKSNVLLEELNKRGMVEEVDGGRSIYEPLSYAENANFGFYSGYDQLPVAEQEVISAPEFAIKQAAAAIVWSGLEEIQNAGRERVIDLVKSKIKVGESTMANQMALAAYLDGTGWNGKGVNGMDIIMPHDPTTGTYGGINRATSTNTFWRSKIQSTAGDPAKDTLPGFMNLLWAACTRGKDHPRLIIAGQTAWAAYLATLQGLQRFTQADSGTMGFPSMDYMGGAARVVLETSDNTGVVATDMYFINPDFLHFRPIKGKNMTPLGADREPVNQDAKVHFIGWAGNMTCSGAKFQGRLWKGS